MHHERSRHCIIRVAVQQACSAVQTTVHHSDAKLIDRVQ